MIARALLKLLVSIIGAGGFAALSHAQDGPPTPQRPLVVVELFQSQGCSSCPPAQDNLNAIAGKPGILALSFAVTYWDNLGWKDTFARDAYTQRQWDYAHNKKHDNVWTPQIYINGQVDLVGTNRRQLDEAIEHASSQGPSMSWNRGQLAIGAGQASSPRDVWLVRYDPRAVSVHVRAGENSGRTLLHRNVVHELVHLGTWNGVPLSFALPPRSSSGLSTAALVQIPKGGDILAASEEPSESEKGTEAVK